MIIDPQLLISILAVLITYLLTSRHFKNQKAHEFNERRLSDLYSPLLGRIKQIRSDGELRVSISSAKSQAWREKCARHPSPDFDHKKHFEPYKKAMDYENDKFRNETMKLYDEMLGIFRDNRHLAFPSTQSWFSKFSQFVELWHRWLQDAIPAEVLEKVETSEEELLPFYADVERHHNRLVKRLSGV